MRVRLQERFSDNENSLCLVVAPAGFGKTYAITSWLSTQQRQYGWVNLEKEDNQPIRFWSQFANAVNQVLPGAVDQMLKLLHLPEPPVISALIPILVGDIETYVTTVEESDPLILVIDNYQHIQERSIHACLMQFINLVSSHLRIVIASRTEEVTSSALLMVRKPLTVVTSSELTFTSDEIKEFIAQECGTQVDTSLIAVITSRCAGWPIMLKFATELYTSQPDLQTFVTAFRGDDPPIYDYLDETIFAEQSPEIQMFLLCTSLFNLISPELCNTLFSDSSSDNISEQSSNSGVAAQLMLRSHELLEQLHSNQLLLTRVDEEGRWYRYQPLWAEMLRKRLRAILPEVEPVLRERARSWYTAQSLSLGYPDLTLSPV